MLHEAQGTPGLAACCARLVPTRFLGGAEAFAHRQLLLVITVQGEQSRALYVAQQ